MFVDGDYYPRVIQTLHGRAVPEFTSLLDSSLADDLELPSPLEQTHLLPSFNLKQLTRSSSPISSDSASLSALSTVSTFDLTAGAAASVDAAVITPPSLVGITAHHNSSSPLSSLSLSPPCSASTPGSSCLGSPVPFISDAVLSCSGSSSGGAAASGKDGDDTVCGGGDESGKGAIVASRSGLTLEEVLLRSAPSTAECDRICLNCWAEETPLWRRNENGQFLCNACGLYLKTYGMNRPLKAVRAAAKAPRPRKPRIIETNPDMECGNCKTKETSLWRRGGDDNSEVLCNACGLFYKMHKSHRPMNMASKGETKKRNRKWSPPAGCSRATTNASARLAAMPYSPLSVRGHGVTSPPLLLPAAASATLSSSHTASSVGGSNSSTVAAGHGMPLLSSASMPFLAAATSSSTLTGGTSTSSLPAPSTAHVQQVQMPFHHFEQQQQQQHMLQSPSSASGQATQTMQQQVQQQHRTSVTFAAAMAAAAAAAGVGIPGMPFPYFASAPAMAASLPLWMMLDSVQQQEQQQQQQLFALAALSNFNTAGMVQSQQALHPGLTSGVPAAGHDNIVQNPLAGTAAALSYGIAGQSSLMHPHASVSSAGSVLSSPPTNTAGGTGAGTSTAVGVSSPQLASADSYAAASNSGAMLSVQQQQLAAASAMTESLYALQQQPQQQPEPQQADISAVADTNNMDEVQRKMEMLESELNLLRSIIALRSRHQT